MIAEEEASLRTGTLVFWLIVFVCLSQLSSLPAGCPCHWKACPKQKFGQRSWETKNRNTSYPFRIRLRVLCLRRTLGFAGCTRKSDCQVCDFNGLRLVLTPLMMRKQPKSGCSQVLGWCDADIVMLRSQDEEPAVPVGDAQPKRLSLPLKQAIHCRCAPDEDLSECRWASWPQIWRFEMRSRWRCDLRKSFLTQGMGKEHADAIGAYKNLRPWCLWIMLDMYGYVNHPCDRYGLFVQAASCGPHRL